MTEGLVSIIVPCYNRADLLAQALRSVLWQTYTNWECLLIDDGSTDDIVGIFQDVARNDERFRYHRQDNSGPSAARNKGLDLARGEFIQFLDDDDIIPERRFESCVSYLKQHPETEAVYTDYVCHQHSRGFVRGLRAQMPAKDPFLALLFELNITFVVLTHSWFFRREVFDSVRFDQSLGNQAEDQECWIRIAENGAKFGYLDEVLAIYRTTPASLASDESLLLRRKIDVLQRYATHPKVVDHREDFRSAVHYLRERLAIGYFMKKSFGAGLNVVRVQWPESGWHGRLKMMGWFVLMLLFSKEQVARMREWLFLHTSVRWGGWKEFKVWTPPDSIRSLMSS
ncbi:MAG: hypothetical protein HW412_1145 [Bacteroidetes bacterium]|nr:hypothetical protein [Bacteroidota bacterium]